MARRTPTRQRRTRTDLSLRQRQSLFVLWFTQLLVWLLEHHYDMSLDEAYRPPALAELYAEQGIGSKNSLHCVKLAVDLNVFVNGKLISKKADWQPIGDYWKSLHADCRWGGDFTGKTAGDFRHFSFAYQGRA